MSSLLASRQFQLRVFVEEYYFNKANIEEKRNQEQRTYSPLRNSFNRSSAQDESHLLCNGPVDQPGCVFNKKAQGIRSPPWHGGGPEFKSRPVHQLH